MVNNELNIKKAQIALIHVKWSKMARVWKQLPEAAYLEGFAYPPSIYK